MLSFPYFIKKRNRGGLIREWFSTRVKINVYFKKSRWNRNRIDILRILFHVTKISCKDEKYSLIKRIIYSQNQIKNKVLILWLTSEGVEVGLIFDRNICLTMITMQDE